MCPCQTLALPWFVLGKSTMTMSKSQSYGSSCGTPFKSRMNIVSLLDSTLINTTVKSLYIFKTNARTHDLQEDVPPWIPSMVWYLQVSQKFVEHRWYCNHLQSITIHPASTDLLPRRTGWASKPIRFWRKASQIEEADSDPSPQVLSYLKLKMECISDI